MGGDAEMKKSWLDVVDQIWEIIDIRGAYMDWLRDKPLWVKIVPQLILLALYLLMLFLP